MIATRSAILVTVDCLRADHVGFMGYRRPTTPFLDSLASGSQVFRQACVAGAPTYHSLPSILAARAPFALGRDVLGIAPGEPTLTTAFQRLGHRTAAFLAANPYLSSRFGYEQGFEVFYDFLAPDPHSQKREGNAASRLRTKWNRRVANACHSFDKLGSVYDELYFQYCERLATPAQSLDQLRRFPSAEAIVDTAIQWLEGVSHQPFFLWLHLMDPHAPYYPTRQALSEMSSQLDATRARYLNSSWKRHDLSQTRAAGYRREIIELYDAGIRWVDTQLHRLARYLQMAGRWDDCVLAVTADHGEEFLEHGGRYHAPATLYQEIVHVPLLIRSPESRPRVVDEPFSLLQLAPAILDEVGVANLERGYPQFQVEGASTRSDVVVSECISSCSNPLDEAERIGPRMLSVRDARFKVIIDFAGSEEWLFDLRDDPEERRPIPLFERRDVRTRLLAHARQHVVDSYQLTNADLRVRSRLRDIQLKLANSRMKVAV